MDCKVVLDSRKILVDRDELNFEANILPMSLFEEDVSSYRFRKIDLKYLSDDIELLISKSRNTVYVLFEKPEFFDDHLLKSKILKRFKKKYVLTLYYPTPVRKMISTLVFFGFMFTSFVTKPLNSTSFFFKQVSS